MLLGSTPNEPKAKGLESIEDDYSGPTTGSPTKTMDYCPDIMRHEVALCRHVTLLPYTQIRVKLVTRIPCLIHMDLKNFLWTKCHVRLAITNHEFVEKKLSEIELTNFSAVENNLPKGLVISYATRSSIIRLAVNGTMCTGICESLI